MKHFSFLASLAMPGLIVLGAVLAGPVAFVRGDELSDPVGDIFPTYLGYHLPGMDVVSHGVTLVGDRVIFFGRMEGPIAPTQAIGGLYLFGVDRGQGTARFLGPAAPPIIGPNVLWDSIVRINPNGTGLFNNTIAGVITPLDPKDIVIDGDTLLASVPLSLMLPAATRPPCEWTYNLWPRNGIGQNVQVSDLAPDDGNSPVQTIPEVTCTTDRDLLWPPNHRMQEVRVIIQATDLCTNAEDLILEVIATSDEPDNAENDGNTTGDTDGLDGFTAPVDVTQFFTFNPNTSCFEGTVLLRAERMEGAFGRTYTIEARVMNNDHNWASSRCTVTVASDQPL